jgi:hypothetical protein
MSGVDLAALVRHAYELAAAFDIRLIETDARPEEACAIPALRTVISSPMIDQTIYAIALHEMGHLLSPLGSLRQHETPASAARLHNLMLEEETAAWDWAAHYALEWTPAMQAVREWAYQTYVAGPVASPSSSPAPSYPARRVNTDASAFGKSIKWSKKS